MATEVKTTRLSSTELKRNTAEVLNSVAFGKIEAVVERYGEPLVKIIPMKTVKRKYDFEKALDGYFGAIPNFPDVRKFRHFRRRAPKL
jgi:prevent-host-death family protein